jgi:hypothetical protein
MSNLSDDRKRAWVILAMILGGGLCIAGLANMIAGKFWPSSLLVGNGLILIGNAVQPEVLFSEENMLGDGNRGKWRVFLTLLGATVIFLGGITHLLID